MLTNTGSAVLWNLLADGCDVTPAQLEDWAERTGRFDIGGTPDNALPYMDADQKIVAFRRVMGREPPSDIVAHWRTLRAPDAETAEGDG